MANDPLGMVMPEDDDDRPHLNAVIGGMLSMRAAARQILEMIDEMSEAEVRATGWSSDDLASLERLAAMPIAGVTYGKWPAPKEESKS